ncbi:MAG TPA: 16S rRNA (guanine(527)-N(7))-methyltransferase RsmG [Acidobacteriaceae bacterium]|nr:16S rRNA (guanine(527)-N(7))-methyltransferase RsmG [Acidobacteriaceae bacterium]
MPMLSGPLPASLWEQLAKYLHLLSRWNQKMNLTAIRNPQELVEVHLAECLRCAQRLPQGIQTLLDFGSGAGLPGIPIQLARPEIAVTLTESQSKKSAFLQEAVRVLGMHQSHVYAGRVEAMPAEQCFDVVTLRAVDQMEQILPAAIERVAQGGWCVVLTTEMQMQAIRGATPELAWQVGDTISGSMQRILLLGQRTIETH